MNGDESRQVFCEEEKQRSWSWFTSQRWIGRKDSEEERAGGVSKQMQKNNNKALCYFGYEITSQ